MKDLRQFIKKTIREYLNEGVYSDVENLEMVAASISTIIGESIMRQGFNRVDRMRSGTRFMNRYLNGVDVMITTQVDFSDDINVFFKIQLMGERKTNSTQRDLDRINGEYKNLFNSIMKEIDKRKLSGDFDHLNVDFNVEHFVDGL